MFVKRPCGCSLSPAYKTCILFDAYIQLDWFVCVDRSTAPRPSCPFGAVKKERWRSSSYRHNSSEHMASPRHRRVLSKLDTKPHQRYNGEESELTPPTPTFFPNAADDVEEANTPPTTSPYDLLKAKDKIHTDVPKRLIPFSTPIEELDPKNIPAATNGFALSLMGFVTYMRMVNKTFFASSWHIDRVIEGFILWGLATQAVYLAKCAFAPGAVKKDLLEAPTNVSLASVPATVCVLCANLYAMGWMPQRLAGFAVFIASLLYVLNSCFFISLVWGKTRLDTFILIPTIGVSLFAATASAFQPPQVLLALSLWVAVAAMVILLPLATYRTLTDMTAAPGTSAALLQSGPSFLCATWYSGLSVDMSGNVSHPATFGVQNGWVTKKMGPFLFGCSVLWVFFAVYGIYQRRETIRRAWFNPTFTAFTFPLESSANAAMAYYIKNMDSQFALIWAGVISCIVVVAVPAMNFMYFRSLEDWLVNTQVGAFSKDFETGQYRYKPAPSIRAMTFGSEIAMAARKTKRRSQ